MVISHDIILQKYYDDYFEISEHSKEYNYVLEDNNESNNTHFIIFYDKLLLHLDIFHLFRVEMFV